MDDRPSPAISSEDMSEWHSKAIELVTSGKQQVLYIYGKAGTGKIELALHICEHYKGRVQAGAMFRWAHTTCIQLSTTASIPRSYLHRNAPQQQQQQQPQHHGATSYTSPPPPYGDVAEVTSGDDVIVVASDSELKDEE